MDGPSSPLPRDQQRARVSTPDGIVSAFLGRLSPLPEIDWDVCPKCGAPTATVTEVPELDIHETTLIDKIATQGSVVAFDIHVDERCARLRSERTEAAIQRAMDASSPIVTFPRWETKGLFQVRKPWGKDES